MAGAAYGFAGMGPFRGGQAEYLRVPYGDFNCLRLPEDARAFFWFKGQAIGTGQANIKHYNRQLRDLIHAGRAKPSLII
jgi:hypothetical protein